MKKIKKSKNTIILCLSIISFTVFFACNQPKPMAPLPFLYKFSKIDTNLKGYLLLSPYEIYYWRYGQLIIIDNRGNVKFQRQIFGPIFCFRQFKMDGKTCYYYIVDDPKAYHIKNINLSTGYIVILDSALNEIKQIHLTPFKDQPISKNEGLDLHDFIFLAEDHYITICAFEKCVTNIPDSLKPNPKAKIVAPIIQEIKNGKTIWQWDASNYPEFYSSSTLQNHYSYSTVTHNYMHFNSAIIDPSDSNLICSFRNTNQIIKISRKSGEIMWRLGGKTSDFKLEPDQYFLRQHNATLIDNNSTLLLYDNGDSTLRQSSRILEFKLDEVHKQVTSFKALNIPKPYSRYMGSVEKRGDNYIICGGSSTYILEMNSITGEILMEMQNNQPIYRTTVIENIDGILKK